MPAHRPEPDRTRIILSLHWEEGDPDLPALTKPRTGSARDGSGPQPRTPAIMFIPLALTLPNRVSHAVEAYRLRQAEREIARVLALFWQQEYQP